MVVCLDRGADLHIAQLMPLLLTVSCFSKIQICFTFLVPAHPGGPGQRAVKRVCVCVKVQRRATRLIQGFSKLSYEERFQKLELTSNYPGNKKTTGRWYSYSRS